MWFLWSVFLLLAFIILFSGNSYNSTGDTLYAIFLRVRGWGKHHQWVWGKHHQWVNTLQPLVSLHSPAGCTLTYKQQHCNHRRR